MGTSVASGRQVCERQRVQGGRSGRTPRGSEFPAALPLHGSRSNGSLPSSRIVGAGPVKASAPIRRPSAFEAYVACLQNTEMGNSMTEQDKKHLVTSFIEALRAGNADGFRSIITDDVLWTLPGTSLVSGVAKGVEGILKCASCIVEFGANVEIQHIVLGYEGVVLLLHNTGKRNGRILDEHLTTVLTLRNGKIARLDTYISDIEMVDAYFA